MRGFRIVMLVFSVISANAQFQLEQNTLKKYSLNELWDMSYEILEGNDTLKIRKYCSAFLERAKTEENNWAKVNAYDYMTWAYPNLALEYNDSIIQMTRDSPQGHYPAQGYLGKANYYQEIWQPDDALREFAATMEVAKEQGCNDHIFQAKLGVASLRGQWGDHWKALELYKECLKYEEEEPNRISYEDRTSLYLDLALAYFDSKQHQEAAKFIKKGKKLALDNEDKELYYKLLSIEGYNNVVDGRLLIGLDSLKKAAPHREQRSFGINQYYQGMAYLKLDKTNKATNFFLTMDSLYEINGDAYRELQSALRFLLEGARKNNDLEKVNELSAKALNIDSIIGLRSSIFRQTAFKEYDLPEFLDQRTVFMKKLTRQKWIIWLIFGLLALSLLWGYNNRKKKLLFEKHYQKIMDSKVEYSHLSFVPVSDMKSPNHQYHSEKIIQKDKSENSTTDNQKLDVDILDIAKGPSDITVEAILSRLKRFEDKQGFLDSELGLNSLAKELGTNHKYLSLVINEYKGQDFRNYVKDLRITHAINSIKENRENVRLGIAQLAEKYGFKSPDSFGRAFKWKTQMTPTRFFEKLTSDIS